jgi:poly(A) polymerase
MTNHIPPNVHQINKASISKNALSVVNTLLESGFQAYLVGGCVRDLALGLKPKDFDVSTNARPEEIDKLFRRSRIIGRRFRIVHVYCGRDIIEVTTFRGNLPHVDDAHPHSVRSETGQLLRDNVYGSIEEDAIRRDFTVNALYYDTKNDHVLDFCDGINDLNSRTLRIIGDPLQRYREDPVRMLRAIRFAAKLDFHIEAESSEAIPELSEQLSHIPAARLFDEALKLFLTGYGERTYQLLKQYRLFEYLFPQTHLCLDDNFTDRLITLSLVNTDYRIANKLGITPAFFFSVALWSPLQNHFLALKTNKKPDSAALQEAAQKTISEQLSRTAIPKRFTIPMRDIWHLQLRLPNRHGKKAIKLLDHARFRAAYDFLLLREDCGDPTDNLGAWWTNYQDADSQKRKTMVMALSGPHGRKRKRPPRKRVSHD